MGKLNAFILLTATCRSTAIKREQILVFPRQQQLCKCSTILCYVYIANLVCIIWTLTDERISEARYSKTKCTIEDSGLLGCDYAVVVCIISEEHSAFMLKAQGAQEEWTPWPLEMKVLCSLKMLGNSNPATLCYILEDLNCQVHSCRNLRSFWI
jgi:hypothetical protein